MKVKILYIDKTQSFCDYERYLPLVSQERRERIARLRRDNMKLISLLAELLIRHEIKNSIGISNSEIAFGYGEHGKPYLMGHKDYHFSVSHSGSCIAFADGNVPIGVDTEKVSAVRFGIAKRFFTENEYMYLKKSKTPDSDFYKIWTAKEAYIKMLGVGLSKSLSSFDVLDGSLDCGLASTLLNEYALSVCAEGVTGIETEEVQPESLLN